MSVFPDFNNNGIPDYKEPWFWKLTWRLNLFIARTFSPPHTAYRRGLETIESARAKALGQ